MAQHNLRQTSGKIAIVPQKLKTENPINFEATQADMKPVKTDLDDNLQCTFLHQRVSKNLKMNCSIPRLDSIAIGTFNMSDPFSDSDSEADNIKNVVRWLEKLPSKEDWFKIEECSLDRHGDFGKESASKNESLLKFDPTQPSTSYNSNTWESINLEDNSPKTKEVKFKKSPEKVKLDKLIQIKGAEVRGENSKNSKMLTEQKGRLKNSSGRLEKFKNISLASTSRTDNNQSSSNNAKKVDKFQTRRHPYNLRNLESRKGAAFQERVTRTRRMCSIRSQENRRRAGENTSMNSVGNENCQVENLNSARKLKSPFTKQAKSNSLGLFSGVPTLSSLKLNDELKEMEENFQNQDEGSEKQNDVERKVLIRSKLENNKKLLNTVKDIVNVIDNSHDLIKKSNKIGNEGIDSPGLTTSKQSNEDLRRKKVKLNNSFPKKPLFVNSKLEETLNVSMELAVNRYKRSYGNRETNWLNTTKRSFDELEGPPKKKKKINCEI